MAGIGSYLSSLPPGVRRAVAYFYLGWAAQYALLYFLYCLLKDRFEQLPLMAFLQMALIGIILCVFLTRARNWARILAISCNIISISYGIFTILYLGQSPTMMVCSALMIGFFGLSTFYLFNRETADFFKRQSRKTPEPGSDADGAG